MRKTLNIPCTAKTKGFFCNICRAEDGKWEKKKNKLGCRFSKKIKLRASVAASSHVNQAKGIDKQYRGSVIDPQPHCVYRNCIPHAFLALSFMTRFMTVHRFVSVVFIVIFKFIRLNTYLAFMKVFNEKKSSLLCNILL